MNNVSRIHAVGILFESPDRHILALKRNPNTPEGGTWGLVGGKIVGQETKVSTAILKTRAEIGYTLEPGQLRFLKTYHWHRTDLNITFEVFKVTVATKDIVRRLDTEGNIDSWWVSPNELAQRPDLMQGLYPILEDAYLAGQRDE